MLPKPGALRSLFLAGFIASGWVLVLCLLNRALLGASGWWEGIAAGAAIAWLWTRSGSVRLVGCLLGCGLLFAASAGLLPSPAMQPRAMFQGASIGFLLGFVAIARLEWKRTHAWLLRMCTVGGDAAGLEWLKRHAPRS